MSTVINLILDTIGSNELVIGSVDNWDGKSITISRDDVSECKRDDFNYPGVYFLTCFDENTGEDKVYIGEADNMKNRLKNHIQQYKQGNEKYYWSKAICFVGSSLDKGVIRYIEKVLVQEAKINGAYEVLTKNTFESPIDEIQQIKADNFISKIRVLLNALGYIKILESTQKVTKNTNLLYCKGNKGEGTGFFSANGFTVLKGSIVSDHVVDSLQKYNKPYYELRMKLESDGTIVDRKFTRDYEFKAPSAASTVIIGNNTSGSEKWKSQKKKA